MSVATWLPTVVFVPLIGFGLYRRLKRTFGRQELAPKRMVARMALISVVCAFFLAAMPTTIGFVAASSGAALGVGLAAFGLAHTHFEASLEGKFYTPNKWIGLVVTALFLGRMVARMVSAYQAGVPPMELQRSPFTMAVFFLMAGYYICYYAGVLRRSRALVMPPVAEDR